jgi:hypothetical protein
VVSTANGGNSWTVQGTGTSRALRATSCPASDRCLAAGDAAAILGVTPTAKPDSIAASEPVVPTAGAEGLRSDPNQVSCQARVLRSEILARGLGLSRRSIRISGRARALACHDDRITRVQVALARPLRRGQCQFLGSNGRLGKSRSCNRPVYQFARVRYGPARNTTDWTFSQRVLLPPARYQILVRAQDRHGLFEAGTVRRAASIGRAGR